jgi:hypothetical protein
MKKISLKIALKYLFPMMVICFVMIISCSKQKDYPANPEWLNLRISQMDTSAFYEGTAVSLYKWDNNFYYLIANPLANSIFTDLYDYQGISYAWTNDKFDNFLKNREKIRVVWSRPF